MKYFRQTENIGKNITSKCLPSIFVILTFQPLSSMPLIHVFPHLLLGITVSIYFIPLSTYFPLRANHEPEFGAYYSCLFFCLSGSKIPNLCSINSSTCPLFIVAIYYPSWEVQIIFYHSDLTLILF